MRTDPTAYARKRRARHGPAGQGGNRRPRTAWAFVALAVTVLASGCGYHVGGRGSQLPPEIRTIAVPALKNETNRYRIEQRLTQALIHEFVARTNYRIVSDPAGADAVLHGEITNLDSSAVVFDSETGRATTMLVTVQLKVSLDDRHTGKMLYRNDNFLFREPYQISTDVAGFFEEQDPALERMARDFASRLVSAVVENF